MNKSLGKKILAVLAAAAVPFTTLLSSAPLAANAANNVTFDTKTSSVVSSGTSGYTQIKGRNIAENESDDYKLNYEYTGNIFTANSSLYDYLSDNEINGESRYSTALGYADAYTCFNDAISGQLVSPGTENLTIRYKDDKDEGVNSDFTVYLFSSKSGRNNGWPGAAMKQNGKPTYYSYTIKYSDLGFTPDRIIICGKSGGALWEGTTLYLDDKSDLKKGESYTIFKDKITVGKALDIYDRNTSYQVPLYFGCFYLDDDPKDEKAGDYAGHYQIYNKADGTYKGRTHNNYYQNFYWQANLSLRRDDRVGESDIKNRVNFDASVQGLVDNVLTNNTITQNGKTLPYFSDEWADSHSNLVKYWHNIAFPFYEIEVDANKVHGDGGAGKARYYQFNSKEGDKYSLYFQPDDANKTGMYQETKTAIVSQETTTDNKGTISYLPFNSKSDAEKNALGFGMNFEMSFQIRSDGKVDTYDSNGKPTGKSVNATFEFMGDDDVWVFIDDKLVLDLGGAHKDTTGIIDFAEKKVYANDAITLGAGSGKDDLSGNLSSQKIVNLKDVMVSDTFNADNTYNEEKVHTLKMFYMERGMYESDLLVRFNFSAIPNKNTLKVREITKFTGINAGLIDLTKKAADYDVFDYSVSNNGTSSSDVGKSGILSPTYNSYERDVLGQKALLSGQEYIPYIYLDTSQHLSGGDKWSTKNARIAAKLTGNGSTIVYGEKMADDLYRFDVSGGYTSVDFQRLNPSDNSVWNHADLGGFTIGSTYKITDWGTATLIGEGSGPYTEHDFDPAQGNSVKNVNYIWTDDAASIISGTDTNGLTGTTDAGGSFNLMYGTDEKESSAEFQKQFKKDSSMTVSQNDDLQTVKRDGNVEDFSSTRYRTVSEYYDTAVSIVDKGGNPVTNNGTNTNTKYTYANTSAVDPNDPVQITETFVNTPKVYSLSVTKELAPDDENAAEAFTFHLSLTNIFGISGMDAGSDDYAKLDIIINGIKQQLGSSAEFTLQRNQTAVIEGIPYGTSYAITEVIGADSSYEPKENENPSGTIGQDDSGAPTGTDSQETVVNTRKTGELSLSKQLIDNDETESGIDNSTLFTFKVALTNAEADLNDYKDGFRYQTTSMTGPAAIEGSTIVFYDVASKTFTVQVSVDESVVLSGLPYGTTYSVNEENIPEEWTSSVNLTGAVSIGDESSSVTVSNTYTPNPKYGSLRISKNVLTSTGSEDIPEDIKQQGFTFTVTLTNAAGEPVSGVFNTQYYLNNTNTGSGTVTFTTSGEYTLILKDDESIVISNIPVDTVYTVEEAVNAEYEQTFENTNSGTIAKDTVSEVKFTNKKKFIPYTLPESGFDDTRMYFVFALSGMMLCGLAYFFVNRKKVNS